MKRSTTLYITRGALISALYVVFTLLSSVFGLSSGVIQFRISEMLCILPIFLPEAVLGLTLGCLLANLMTSAVIWDIIFGSVATFIGALSARLLRNLPERLKFISTLPTVFSNAIIVPIVLIYAYGATEAYLWLMLTVGIGELACALVGGTGLYYTLKKANIASLIK